MIESGRRNHAPSMRWWLVATALSAYTVLCWLIGSWVVAGWLADHLPG